MFEFESENIIHFDIILRMQLGKSVNIRYLQ